MCKNFMVIRHSIKELLAKSMVTRPMKCIVDTLIYLMTFLNTFPNIFKILIYSIHKHFKMN